MFPLAPQGGQGFVCPELPPTLMPHAIAAAAPPRARLRSFLMAGTVYLFLAGTGLALVRSRAALPPRLFQTHRPPILADVVLNPQPTPPPTVVRVAGPPAGTAAALPQPAAPALRGLLDPVDPSRIPSGLPTDDLAHLQPTSPVGVPATSGPRVGTGSGTPGAMEFLEPSQVRVLYQVNPVYPPLARMAHVQGSVVLMMTIDAMGVPTEVQVLQGPPAFREEALRAARQWRFEPARQAGVPVPASFRLTLNFRLQ
ncbi:MAG TPA: energy transducer TonB [Holophagaceae bacterium]